MKFTISYKAEWGESLHADITFFARDGKRKVVDLAMNTVDGYHWMAETYTLENRHHPFVAVAYYYKVVDAEGNVVRGNLLLLLEPMCMRRTETISCPTSGWMMSMSCWAVSSTIRLR